VETADEGVAGFLDLNRGSELEIVRRVESGDTPGGAGAVRQDAALASGTVAIQLEFVLMPAAVEDVAVGADRDAEIRVHTVVDVGADDPMTMQLSARATDDLVELVVEENAGGGAAMSALV